MTPTHILVADDHPVMRMVLRMAVQEVAPEASIAEAGDYPAAIRETTIRQPDLMLTDLYMPGEEPFAGLRLLRFAAPAARLVVVSASGEPDHIRQALRLGADGYIPKATRPGVFDAALRLVLSGESYVPPAALLPEASATPEAPEFALRSAQARVANLTVRQREIARRLGQGKSNKEIARELGVAETTVKLHVANVLRALHVRRRAQAALVLTQIGTVLGLILE